MSSDKPDVLMIVMRGNRRSEEYAKKSRKTWERYGFNVEYFSAYTPETMPDYLDFSVRDKTNKTFMLEKKLNKKVEPYFSETEKAVWYSHLEVWKYIIEQNKSYIVAEHDAILKHDNFDCKECYLRKLSSSILQSVYLTPQFLERWFSYFDNKPRLNPDGAIANFLITYDRGNRGTEFDKPLIHNYQNEVDLKPWPVFADWSESTIEHGLYNECLDDTDT
jgi:hypothetical protein